MRRQFSIFLLLVMLFSACKKNKEEENSLRIISTYNVVVPECSGLSYYKNDLFITVSDRLEKVYIISKTGQLIDSLAYKGQNPEGVFWDSKTDYIYVVEEKSKEVVELNAIGEELNRFEVVYNNLYEKQGLEGITLNPVNDHLYIVSEKAPGFLFEFTRDGEEIRRFELTFAKDYSSVYYDQNLNKLWILSDNSATLTRCDLQGSPEESWNTGIVKGEGVVVDSQSRIAYIISDTDGKLYQLSY